MRNPSKITIFEYFYTPPSEAVLEASSIFSQRYLGGFEMVLEVCVFRFGPSVELIKIYVTRKGAAQEKAELCRPIISVHNT